MKIIYQKKEMSKEEMVKMTMSKDTKGLKDMISGEVYQIKNYVFFERDEKQILTIETDKGVFSGTSTVFCSTFADYASIFEDEDFSIKKIEGNSKKGRPFIDCTIA